jgi:hypothetical protein
MQVEMSNYEIAIPQTPKILVGFNTNNFIQERHKKYTKCEAFSQHTEVLP